MRYYVFRRPFCYSARRAMSAVIILELIGGAPPSGGGRSRIIGSGIIAA